MAQDQLKVVEERIKALTEQLDRIEDELEDLEITRRTLARLNGKLPVAADGLASTMLGGAPRPVAIPTNFAMVESVLADAEANGKDGLTASELVQAISSRYWPGLVAQQIMPGVYAFAKNGRLRKTVSGKFKRIKKNEGPANYSAEPS